MENRCKPRKARAAAQQASVEQPALACPAWELAPWRDCRHTRAPASPPCLWGSGTGFSDTVFREYHPKFFMET